MGKKTDNFPEAQDIKQRKHCRVAYSIDNHQPVLCSIVSDQPLFYFEEEIYEEDDDILMDEELLALDRDIQELKKKVEAYDRLSLEFSQPADTRVREFIADCQLIGEKDIQADHDIEILIEELSKSRMAQALMGCADDHHVVMRYSVEVFDASYDKTGHQILINPNLPQADQLLLAVRELRRHWQARQGAMINPLYFQPDQAILVNRAQLADLSVFIVRVAWELQLSGVKSAWQRIENSSMSDLGRTFAREAYVDFRTLNNGNAASAVFETWFLSERCRTADKVIIQKMLADYEGLVFDMEQVSRTVSMDLIGALGSAPFGKNYLAQYAQLIMNDPIFTDVRDRSNANFLWFIKFEKSFRETEQELQSEESNLKSGVRSDDISNNKDTHDGQDTDIISLPIHRQGHGQKDTKPEDADDSTNVVYVQFC
ncbi:MAG: DUF6782 family putative metallopeptidase [Pseudomonadota bacterium]